MENFGTKTALFIEISNKLINITPLRKIILEADLPGKLQNTLVGAVDLQMYGRGVKQTIQFKQGETEKIRALRVSRYPSMPHWSASISGTETQLICQQIEEIRFTQELRQGSTQQQQCSHHCDEKHSGLERHRGVNDGIDYFLKCASERWLVSSDCVSAQNQCCLCQLKQTITNSIE